MRAHDSHCQKNAIVIRARPRLRRLYACHVMNATPKMAIHHKAGLPPSWIQEPRSYEYPSLSNQTGLRSIGQAHHGDDAACDARRSLW